MPVIKSNLAPAKLMPFSMADIEAAARRMLLRARSQAEQLLAGAQDEAERMRQSASAEGLEAGRREGLRRGLEEGRRAGHDEALNECRQELSGLIGTLAGTAAQIDASRRELKASVVAEVAELAIAISRRVIKTRAAVDPEVLKGNLSEAMSLVIHATDVRIALHPSQIQLLEKELPNLRLKWPNLEHVSLAADDSVSPGGCRLTTPGGEIDADLGRQLDGIIGELMNGKECESSISSRG